MNRGNFLKSLLGVGAAVAVSPIISNTNFSKSELDETLAKLKKLKSNVNLVWDSKNINLIDFELIEDSKKLTFPIHNYYVKCKDNKYDIDLSYDYTFSIVKYRLLIGDYNGARGILCCGKQMLKHSADKNISDDYIKFTGKFFNDEFVSLCKEVSMEHRIRKMSI
jgi:hypothetical protein